MKIFVGGYQLSVGVELVVAVVALVSMLEEY